ncbi:MAG: hypothetical protein ABIK09_10285 [Pseudomonadota bacterium]
MRWMRILVLLLTLGLVGWAVPDTSFAMEQDNPKVKMVSGKDRQKNPEKKRIKNGQNKKKIKRVRKGPPKKPKKKKKQGFKEPKWSVGVRGAMTPASDMDIKKTGGGGEDYDPRLAFGAGVITQYRVFDKPTIYILGEFTYWWQELKDQTTSTKDGLVTVSTGVRFNVWGQANKAHDRLFVKGLVGYTYYAANKDNSTANGGMGASDRSGIYFGGGVGFEHLFTGLPISVFVDTGVYAHNFSLDPAADEKGASLVTWEIGAGALYHF